MPPKPWRMRRFRTTDSELTGLAKVMRYACPLCSHSCPSLKIYVSHLRVTHSKEPTFNILCGVNECREVFRTFSAFNSHIYRHHRVEIGITSSAGETSEANQPAEYNWTSESANDSCADDHEGGAVESDVSCPGESMTSAKRRSSSSSVAAKMLLQLREGHQVSQAALADVISCCRHLCTQVLKSFRMDLIASLGPSMEDKMFEINLESYDPFQQIDTNYLFEKFCRENLGCLVSFQF